ncbi:MAG TPA: GyrI-like domain-containing protein [Caulobacterales bacterium]|nr:GyrI-like domain-containing protein [Caulobacterales bacterium]
MRWILGLVLVVALITGALYGVGRFLLPNTLEVRREATIARPRVAIFAMSNDLKIVKEWSPFYALDPDADYSFSGDSPGAGQTMRWRSTNRQVGNGQMAIVRSDDSQTIESIIQLNDQVTLNSVMREQPITPHSTHVTWAVSAECSDGWINVPCRYMNLVLRGMIQRHLDAGLGRLKALSEELPDVDFEDLRPEFETVEPQTYVFSPITTSDSDAAQMDAALSQGVGQVNDFFARNPGVTRAGDQVRVTTTTSTDTQNHQISFRVGYPFSGPTPLTVVGVQIGQTPSGRVMRVTHHGPRAHIRNTYDEIGAYLLAHRIAAEGAPWEIWVNDGGDANPDATQIEIYVPLK